MASSIENRSYNARQASLEDINLDQFLKISNYEDTLKQLGILTLKVLKFRRNFSFDTK